jgi:hypothetical protein
MTFPDLNPYPLGQIAPTSGTPLSILANFADLAFTRAKVVTVFGLSGNSGAVYVGRSNMNRSTLVGVLLIVSPGETKTLPFSELAGNCLDLTKFFVDTDTTGDAALVDVLFA